MSTPKIYFDLLYSMLQQSHSKLVFWNYRVRISAEVPAILTGLYRDLIITRQITGHYSKIGHVQILTYHHS